MDATGGQAGAQGKSRRDRQARVPGKSEAGEHATTAAEQGGQEEEEADEEDFFSVKRRNVFGEDGATEDGAEMAAAAAAAALSSGTGKKKKLKIKVGVGLPCAKWVQNCILYGLMQVCFMWQTHDFPTSVFHAALSVASHHRALCTQLLLHPPHQVTAAPSLASHPTAAPSVPRYCCTFHTLPLPRSL